MDDQMIKDTMTMLKCYQSCTKTINHCLEMGGEHASPNHINLLMDCAKICQLAADFAIRGSANHATLCRLCVDICRSCAEECESMAEDDEEMQNCAQTCRDCADTCERMAEV